MTPFCEALSHPVGLPECTLPAHHAGAHVFGFHPPEVLLDRCARLLRKLEHQRGELLDGFRFRLRRETALSGRMRSAREWIRSGAPDEALLELDLRRRPLRQRGGTR